MQLTYHFRFIKSTWGISIELTAEDLIYTECPHCNKVTDRIFLKTSAAFKITDAEKSYAIKALERIASHVHDNLKPEQKIIIDITRIKLADTDSQAEGFYCAMAGWLSERYNIQPPPVDITFNKKWNKYEFIFH
jgi:hypothetical protein